MLHLKVIFQILKKQKSRVYGFINTVGLETVLGVGGLLFSSYTRTMCCYTTARRYILWFPEFFTNFKNGAHFAKIV